MTAIATPDAEAALVDLLSWLDERDHDFVPPAPFSHANRLTQPDLPPPEQRDEIMGWSRSFDPDRADPDLVAMLQRAGMLALEGDRARSRLRAARLQGCLFLHSAYPTQAEDSVFLGPDSYRFADFIAAERGRGPLDGVHVDIGTGAGVAAILTALALPDANVFAVDPNPAALTLARANARHNGVAVQFIEGRGLDGVPDRIAAAMSNPPFMIDPEGRLYRDGGGRHGLDLALALVAEAVPRLDPDGHFLLFTGTPIRAGRDPLPDALAEAAPGCRIDVRHIDPDVYGEELATPAYAGVDRIALAGAVISPSAERGE